MRILLTALLLLALPGCQSTPPARFYSLASTASASTNGTFNKGLRIGQFTFPDYLRRPNIITRTSSGRIEVAEFDRWAGTLENDFHRALGTRLGDNLGTPRLSIYSSEPRFKPDYLVTGEVLAFDGTIGGSLTLNVQWLILDGGEWRTAGHPAQPYHRSGGRRRFRCPRRRPQPCCATTRGRDRRRVS